MQSIFSEWSPWDLLMDVECGGEEPRRILRISVKQVKWEAAELRWIEGEFGLRPQHSKC